MAFFPLTGPKLAAPYSDALYVPERFCHKGGFLTFGANYNLTTRDSEAWLHKTTTSNNASMPVSSTNQTNYERGAVYVRYRYDTTNGDPNGYFWQFHNGSSYDDYFYVSNITSDGDSFWAKVSNDEDSFTWSAVANVLNDGDVHIIGMGWDYSSNKIWHSVDLEILERSATLTTVPNSNILYLLSDSTPSTNPESYLQYFITAHEWSEKEVFELYKDPFSWRGKPISYFFFDHSTRDDSPKFESSASANPLSSTTLTIPKPAGTANGDLLIAAMAHSIGGASVTTPPAGWTEIYNVSGSSVAHAVYWKNAGASEPASYDFGWSTSGNLLGDIQRFSGQFGANPIDVIAPSKTASGSTFFPDPITPTNSPSTIVSSVAHDEGDLHSPPLRPYGYETTFIDQHGGSVSLGACYKYYSGSSTSTGPYWEFSGSDQNIGGQIIIYNDGSGVPPPVDYPLVIGDLDHIGHELEAPTLVSDSQIAADALNHAHELEAPTLTAQQTALADALNHTGHELEEPTLTFVPGAINFPLDVNDAQHIFHTVENFAIQTATNLIVAELSHNHELEDVTLTTTETALLIIDGAEHLQSLSEPLVFAELNALVDGLQHLHELESPALTSPAPWEGYARRKPVGNGSGYAIYPATAGNFELIENRANLQVDQWLPQNTDGLTHARYELYRESNLLDTQTVDQRNTLNDWSPVFNLNGPLAGQYQIRLYDDPQTGLGGTGSWLYADAFRITISEEPEISISDIGHAHEMTSCNPTTLRVLFSENLSHAQSLGVCPTFAQQNLIVNDADHAHELESVQLGAALLAEDLDHNHELESPTLIGAIAYVIPSIDELNHVQSLSEPATSAQLNAFVGDLDHNHLLQDCGLIGGNAIDIAELNHGHELDDITFTSGAELEINALDHGHELGTIALNISIPVNDLGHIHILEAPGVYTRVNLFVGDLEHIQTLDFIDLSTKGNIILDNLDHSHLLQDTFLFFEEGLPAPKRSYYVRAENKTYTVRAENRTYIVR